MSNKTEQIHATQAIAAIKEQVQLEQWQKDIADRQTTGRSITAFCEEQGISKSTYYYRLRKVREYMCRATGVLPKESPEPLKKQQVVPIRVAGETVPENRIEIVSGDFRISFVGETSPLVLKTVIEAIRSC